jgi:hypothetical protein
MPAGNDRYLRTSAIAARCRTMKTRYRPQQSCRLIRAITGTKDAEQWMAEISAPKGAIQQVIVAFADFLSRAVASRRPHGVMRLCREQDEDRGRRRRAMSASISRASHVFSPHLLMNRSVDGLRPVRSHSRATLQARPRAC